MNGPSTASTGGKAVFTFPVKGLDVNGSTNITVSAPGYMPATTTIAVTYDNSGTYMLSAFTFGTIVGGNTLTTGSAGTRTTNASGFLTDNWTGTFTHPSTATTNTLRAGGQLSRGTPPTFTAMKGKVEWRMDAAVTGSQNLIWQKNVPGFAFSGVPIGGTYQTGTAAPTAPSASSSPPSAAP